MGCGSRAFMALMRRNLLYRRKYWLSTVRVPVIFFLLLDGIKYKMLVFVCVCVCVCVYIYIYLDVSWYRICGGGGDDVYVQLLGGENVDREECM
jgi:hypothetical protein